MVVPVFKLLMNSLRVRHCMKADLLSLSLINECSPYQLPFMLTFSYPLFTMVLFSFKKIAEVRPQAGVRSSQWALTQWRKAPF